MLELLQDNLLGIFTEPDEAFKRISVGEMNLLVPIVLLVIIGLLLGAVVTKQMPGKVEQWQKSGREITHDIGPQVKAEKMKAVAYPFFVLVFWALFTFAFATMITKLNGFGDLIGIMNCTGFLVFPYFILILVKYFTVMAPALSFIYSTLLFAMACWTLFALTKIAQSVGKLDIFNAAMAAGVPALFFSMIWFLYELMVELFVMRFMKG